MNNKRQIIIGSLSGIILPIIVLIILHAIRFNHYTLKEFIHNIFALHVAGKFISLCAIPNLLLFFVFMRLNMLNAGRGVIGATLFLTVFILLLKFI